MTTDTIYTRPDVAETFHARPDAAETILTRPRGGGILFAEDFDVPAWVEPTVAEPEIVEPVYDAAALEAARQAGWEAGRLAGRREIEAADEAGLRAAVARLGAGLDSATVAARITAEHTAEALARLLMATFAAALPILCATHGEDEARAVTRAVLPGLSIEPAITIRASPGTAAAAAAEIERIDPEMMARVRLLPAEAMLPGDIRIAWQDGVAVRDMAELWNEIVGVLIPHDLVQPNPAAGATRHGG